MKPESQARRVTGRSQWTTVPSAGAAVLMLVGALAFVGLTKGQGLAAPASVLSVKVEPCSWVECWPCEEHTHWTGAGFLSEYEGFLHGDCQPGGCAVHFCYPTDQSSISVSSALQALQSGKYGDAASLAARFPKSVLINRRLGAVQIKDCGGVVVAHIPLRHAALAAADD